MAESEVLDIQIVYAIYFHSICISQVQINKAYIYNDLKFIDRVHNPISHDWCFVKITPCSFRIWWNRPMI